MSQSSRKTFAFFVSLHALCSAGLAHPDMDEGSCVWFRRIHDHLEKADGFPVEMAIKPHQLERLRKQSSYLAETMFNKYDMIACMNVWIVWCEDIIEKLRNPAKREFMEELLQLLDGLYALMDPEYQHIDEALDAIETAGYLALLVE